MKISKYLFSFILLLGLITGSAYLSDNKIQESEIGPVIQEPDEFPIPQDKIGVDRREYTTLDPWDFFWVGEYFVEYIGDGTGILITSPQGDIIKIPTYEVQKFNDSTIVLVNKIYGANINESYAYFTSFYNVLTGITVDLGSDYGYLRNVLTNEGLLFDNHIANIVTYYLTDDSSYSYNYSKMENSTHYSYIEGIYNGHLLIGQWSDISSYSNYYAINMYTQTNNTVVENMRYPGIGYDLATPDVGYICDTYNTDFTRCVQYNFVTQISSTHIFEGADSNNVRASSYNIRAYNGLMVGDANYRNIFFKHNWSTNTTSYYTHSTIISRPGVSFMPGLSQDIDNNNYLHAVSIHNSTHATGLYACYDTLTNLVFVFSIISDIVNNDVEFNEVWGYIQRDPTQDLYYYSNPSEGIIGSPLDRFTIDLSLTEITPLPDFFTTLENEGIPYIGWTSPKLTFDFPDLGKTVFVLDGDEFSSLMIYEGTKFLDTIALDTYIRAGLIDGNVLYLGGSDSILQVDVASITGPLSLNVGPVSTLYNLVNSEIDYESQIHIFDNSLVFLVYNHTNGKIHFGEFSLLNHTYTWRDVGINDYFDKSTFYRDWAALYFGDGNLTVINYRTGESISYDIMSLYGPYSGAQWWIFDNDNSKIVFLPGFNSSHGEILLMQGMYKDFQDNYAHVTSDLILIDIATGTLSDATKYGFKDERYSSYSGLASGANSSQILVTEPTAEGSELSLLYFDEDLSWDMIAMQSPDNFKVRDRGLKLTPNGFIAQSHQGGIIIHTFYEIMDPIPPAISTVTHTVDPSTSIDIEIRVDVNKGDSAIDFVLLGYTYDTYANVNVTMNSLGNGTWIYNIPAINDPDSAFLEFQITAVDIEGKDDVSVVYHISLYEESTTPSDTIPPVTTPTDTSTETTTTSEPDIITSPTETTEEAGTGLLILATSIMPLMLIPVLLRRRK